MLFGSKNERREEIKLVLYRFAARYSRCPDIWDDDTSLASELFFLSRTVDV